MTVVNRVSEHDPLAGHLGRLSSEQKAAFEHFKELCIEQGLCKPTAINDDDSGDGISDDGTLLRFLRARRFNVAAALEQFKDTASWRKANNLAYLYNHIDVQDFDDTKNLYTHWTGRRDKAGIPLYVFEIAHLTTARMAAYSASCASRPTPTPATSSTPTTSTKMLRLFATYEHLIRFVMPVCSAVPNRPNPESPVTQTTCIVDVSGVGLWQFWRLRGHLQDASVLATAHYPETLGRTFVIGAPSFFPTVWGWIKGWFDPITTSKIFILGPGEVLSTLKMHVDVSDIPKKYGGELDFEFGMPPILDADAVDMFEWVSPFVNKSKQTFPMGPMKWVDGEDGSKTVMAFGSQGGEPRRELVAILRGTEKEEQGNGHILEGAKLEV